MNSSEKSNSINKDNENEQEFDQIKDDHLNLSDKDNQTPLEDDRYVFGWRQYSEITNGRFAMIGFAAIIFCLLYTSPSPRDIR